MTQAQALVILKSGRSVFLTGEPGSGKTYVVNTFVQWLRKQKTKYAVTASTGIAATHIQGKTLHSWAGIKTKESLTPREMQAIARESYVAARIRKAHVLIIDEISMLSARTLDMVDGICRLVHGRDVPFGGIQVVFVGDFFQLPPVIRRSTPEQDTLLTVPDKVFAYESDVWQGLNPCVCYLHEQHRQVDEQFHGLLRAIRGRSVTEYHHEILQSRIVTESDPDVTHFFPHNAQVDTVNTQRLGLLPGVSHRYVMETTGPERLVLGLIASCISPRELMLKKDAIVMFTKNDIERHRYVNGTLGVVTGFEDKSGLPTVRTRDGLSVTVEPAEWTLTEGDRVLAGITQLPLRLGWAITVHKSQGMTLDAAHIDLSYAFEYGQGYVAISRVRSLTGLTLSGYNAKALEVHPAILERDDRFRQASDEAVRTYSAPTPSISLHSPNPSRLSTVDTTAQLYTSGKTPDQIAQERQLKITTIRGHLADWYASGGELDYDQFVSPAQESAIREAADRLGFEHLSPLKQDLPPEITYDHLRFVRAKVQRMSHHEKGRE